MTTTGQQILVSVSWFFVEINNDFLILDFALSIKKGYCVTIAFTKVTFQIIFCCMRNCKFNIWMNIVFGIIQFAKAAKKCGIWLEARCLLAICYAIWPPLYIYI